MVSTVTVIVVVAVSLFLLWSLFTWYKAAQTPYQMRKLNNFIAQLQREDSSFMGNKQAFGVVMKSKYDNFSEDSQFVFVDYDDFRNQYNEFKASL